MIHVKDNIFIEILKWTLKNNSTIVTISEFNNSESQLYYVLKHETRFSEKEHNSHIGQGWNSCV